MKLLFSFFLLSIFAISLFAKNDVIVTIGDREFTKAEYEQIYRKNNTQLNEESDIKTPVEYLDLFVDYKLKVIEAENRGMDTVQAFIDELAGYRKELAKPYLTDITVTDSMVKQAYYRTINEVKASHILLNLSKDASPQDTLLTYNKLIEIRNQFIKGEKTFEELAVEYSEDPSAQQNKGDLGFFRAFNMITDFENAAFETSVGDVSMPIRTSYGYHLVYVTDFVAIDSEIKVAHIMKMFSNLEDTSQEELSFTHELDSLYSLLENGADFGLLAKENSDDKGSSSKNGEMQWISKTFKIKEFADIAYSLKEIGDYSKPIRTPYGVHIVKLIDRRKSQTFDELKETLTKKVKNDATRSKHSKQSFLSKKKAELGYVEYEENIEAFKNYLNASGDSIIENLTNDIKSLPLYKVADSVFTVESFFALQNIKNKNSSRFQSKLVLPNLDLYKDEVIEMYESSILEKKYPEFAQVMQEYRDGMLLFSIMQEEVWDKAVQDTVGLNNYYEKNKGKYLWEKHFSGLLIICFDEAALDSCKKLLSEGITDPLILQSRINIDNSRHIKITKDKWEEGDSERIDHLAFNGPVPERFIPDMQFIHGEVIEAGVPKLLDEAKGLYISDYQQVLEDEWISFLRNKYPIKVNQKLLKKVESL